MTRFVELVGDGRGHRHRRESRPLQRSRPVGRLGLHVDVNQPRSSSLLHSMHLVAHGSASRRSDAMDWPQRSQFP